MNAEKYSTEKAENKDDVFKLYHAFEAGRVVGSDTKTLPTLLWGLLFGFFIGAIVIGELIQKGVIKVK